MIAPAKAGDYLSTGLCAIRPKLSDKVTAVRDSRQLYYLAYGSNLHPLRLRERVPSATLLGLVRVPGRSLRFHKRGQDQSAKCDLVPATAGASAFGALYALKASDKPRLDAAEGAGRGYDEATLEVALAGAAFAPFVYLAAPTHVEPTLRPFHWYKRLVIAGARHHRLPPEYLAFLEAVPSVPDPDADRVRRHEVLLGRMTAGHAAEEVDSPDSATPCRER